MFADAGCRSYGPPLSTPEYLSGTRVADIHGSPASMAATTENRADVADDIFKEVDEDLRAERLRAAGRRYGMLVLAVILLPAIAASAWQYQLFRHRQLGAATASIFFAATKQADSTLHAGGTTGPNAAQAEAARQFDQVVARGPEGFRSLARLRQAQIAWNTGQHKQALAYWDALHDDSDADPTLRGLGNLLWVQHQVDDGDPAVLKSRLGALNTPGSSWRPLAQELDAEIDLRLGHVADARRKLAALAIDGAAPEGLRNRAGGLNDTLDKIKTGG